MAATLKTLKKGVAPKEPFMGEKWGALQERDVLPTLGELVAKLGTVEPLPQEYLAIFGEVSGTGFLEVRLIGGILLQGVAGFKMEATFLGITQPLNLRTPDLHTLLSVTVMVTAFAFKSSKDKDEKAKEKQRKVGRR